MTRHGCTVVFYHYVRDTSGYGMRALTPAVFRDQLDWLQERARVIRYEELSAAIGGRLAFETPVALLTFDDGLTEHLDIVYPELKRRGLSGVFFLNGLFERRSRTLMNVHKTHLLLDLLGARRLAQEIESALERSVDVGRRESDLYRYDGEPEQAIKRLLNYQLPYRETDGLLTALFEQHVGSERETADRFYLSTDHVRHMAEGGMAFGYHSRQHRVLSRLAEEEQRSELSGGVELIRALTGQQAVPFCYPYGHRQTYNAHTLRLLEELGYDAAFNTVRQPVEPWSVSRFEIPRLDTRDLPPLGPGILATGLEVRA